MSVSSACHHYVITCLHSAAADASAYRGGVAAGAELLTDDAARRTRQVVGAAVALLALVVGGGAALRSTLPPPPLAVALSDLTGSALDGESFVRLDLSLRLSGVDALADGELTVAGTTASGLRLVRDGDDRARVRVDLTPDCAQVDAGATGGELTLRLQDADGDPRSLLVDVPADGPLERLLRYRCRTGRRL